MNRCKSFIPYGSTSITLYLSRGIAPSDIWKSKIDDENESNVSIGATLHQACLKWCLQTIAAGNRSVRFSAFQQELCPHRNDERIPPHKSGGGRGGYLCLYNKISHYSSMHKFVLLIPLIYQPQVFPSNQATEVYMAEPVTDFMAVSFTANLFTFQLKKFEKKCPKSVKRYRITDPLPRRNDASGEGDKTECVLERKCE